MSFFDRFRRKPPYQHERLGPMKWHRNTGWLAQSVSLPFSGEPLDVYLAGEEASPSPAASEALEQFIGDPSRLKSPVQSDFFELWQNYFSDMAPPAVLETAEGIWGTEEWVALDITDAQNYSVTLTFNWQAEEDGHLVTVYIQNGESAGSSIDG